MAMYRRIAGAAEMPMLAAMRNVSERVCTSWFVRCLAHRHGNNKDVVQHGTMRGFECCMLVIMAFIST